MAAPALVRTENLNVELGGLPILKGIDFELRAGEVHAITGENGAGKSTLAKVIAGIYQPASGSIFLDGAAVTIKSPGDAIAKGIALIHQEPLIFPDLDVASNIFVGRMPRKATMVDHAEARRRADIILKQLGVSFDARSDVGRLSIAEQQMVELATAMSEDAIVWIFDETTASLTPKEVAELFLIIQELKAKGCAIAIVTHHLDEVFEIADTVTVLRDGTKVAERAIHDLTQPELVSLMVGREIEQQHIKSAHASPGAVMLSVENLVGPGYQGVSIEVREREIVGLAGLVGAGRTELARSLFGITHPSSGVVKVDGNAIHVKNPQHAQALGFAMVPEDRQQHGLFPNLDIGYNASATILRANSTVGWLNQGKLRQAALSILESFRTVYRNLAQPVSQLSGGNQQKTVIGRCLLQNPKLLILDEPTRGVDVGARREVHQFLRKQADDGKAILMISSDLPELLTVTDRIYVMHQGRIVGQMPTGEATEEKIMALAFGGKA